MIYRLSFQRSAQQLVQVEIETVVRTQSDRFILPKWRPGRYELQTYPRNVAGFFVRTPAGDPRDWVALDSHTWELHGRPGESVRIRYLFYANQPDAGGSYVNDEWIYLNPVNFLLAHEGDYASPCTLELALPEGYLLAGLPHPSAEMTFDSYHALADSPFFSARPDALRQVQFSTPGLDGHFWVLSEADLPAERLASDLAALSEVQGRLFGGFTQPEFHYLLLVTPTRFRHGVEHAFSTVLAMGPGSELSEPNMYRSLLELCSHEFFHTWNVKTLRPADLFPYDYAREQYSELHYITEGITTYYGDLMVWKSGIWSLEEWLQAINSELSTHYQTGGRHFTSLEQASFQSWVNGYHRLGFPNRRISFYTKGFLVAMLLDTELRRLSDHRANLDRLMRAFFTEITAQKRGYTGQDFQQAAARMAGVPLDDFFREFVSGVAELIPALHALGEFFGLDLHFILPNNPFEALFGMSISQGNNQWTIEGIQPFCPAETAGLLPGDEITEVNGLPVAETEISYLEAVWASEQQLTLSLIRFGQKRWVHLRRDPDWVWLIPQYSPMAAPSADQLAHREAWRQIG